MSDELLTAPSVPTTETKKKLLLELDLGTLARLSHERDIAPRSKRGNRPPRTQVIRELICEALDVRAAARGEEIPSALPTALEPQDASEPSDGAELPSDQNV